MASRIRIIIAFLLFFVPSAQAGLVERYFDYGPTSTVTDVNLDGNINNILNEINGGLDGDNVDSANGWRLIEILSSSPSAGNQGRVVFLTSNNTLNFDTGSTFITTAVLPNNQTFGGSNTFNGSTNFVGDITGTTNFTGTTNLKGATNTIGDGGSDALTLNLGNGMSSSAMTWTLTGALTFSGTIADLGTVTTANIDGGTMDGVQIGGTTATGELIVNDASDDADGLGSQGTSGQFLQSAGAGINPIFVNGFKFVSATTISAASTSGNITIEANKIYKIIIDITEVATDDTLILRFNASSTGAYFYARTGYAETAGAIGSYSASQTSILINAIEGSADLDFLNAEFTLWTTATGAITVKINGHITTSNSSSQFTDVNMSGKWAESVAPTSFVVLTGGNNFTGKIYLYEMPLS